MADAYPVVTAGLTRGYADSRVGVFANTTINASASSRSNSAIFEPCGD
jgi:hypothetical protein